VLEPKGLPVTSDVSANHLHLTDIDIGYFNASMRLTPPLRQQRDRDAIRAALADGTIDALVSDHTPVDKDAKNLPFAEAEPGATGLELLLSLALHWADAAGLPWIQALAAVTSAPARILAHGPNGDGAFVSRCGRVVGRRSGGRLRLRSGRSLDGQSAALRQPGQAHAVFRLRAAGARPLHARRRQRGLRCRRRLTRQPAASLSTARDAARHAALARVLAPRACRSSRAPRRPHLRGGVSVPRGRGAPSPRRLVVAAHAGRDGHSARVRRRAAGSARLLLSNHVSWLDILAIDAWRPVRFVSKADVRKWPLLGFMVACGGTLFIERERKRDALRVVHQVADALRADGSVAVFPEGTTGAGPVLLPFHANLLQAAISTGTAMQPVALRYADAGAAFSAAPLYLGETSLLQSVWQVACADALVAHVVALAPIEACSGARRELANAARERIQRVLLAGATSV
jgi:1-acyl-sn-glycerol-3-phosphate acyltransferase